MKESKFIELLNLYVDREISEEESAQLEAEVTNNPERRSIYRQYCRMDKACSELAGQLQATVPEPEPIIARASPSRSWGPTGIYAAGLLAAACVAILVMRPNSVAPVPASNEVALNRLPANRTNDEPLMRVTSSQRQLQPVLDVRSLYLGNDNSAPASTLTAMTQNDLLAWMNRIQTNAVPVEPMQRVIFNPAPVMINAGTQTTRTVSPDLQAPAEMAAFRYFER